MIKQLSEQLRKRTWPQGREVKTGHYVQASYVWEGRVFNRALRMHQHVSEPIPPGESAITSLCRGINGKIYGATSGHKSHLFYYDPGPRGDGVCDLGVLEGVKAVRRSVVAVQPNVIIAGASEVTDPKQGGALYRHETVHDHMDEYGTSRGKVEKILVPVQGECVAVLAVDDMRQMVYGLSTPSGIFFRYDVKSGAVKQYGPVATDNVFSHTLVLDSKGNVYGASSLGELFRYSPDLDTVTSPGKRIPSLAGREFYNRLDAAVLEPRTGLIYGAGSADGVLFVMDPETLDIRSLGKPTAEPRVRAMVASLDGRIYGIGGCEDGMGRLFRYDPFRHELKELGILMAVSEVFRHGYEFDAACTGASGEIYFGESEWEGHLFLYFPPVLEAVREPLPKPSL